MKKKQILVYGFMVFIFGLALFMLLRSNTPSFRVLSASVSPEEEKSIILEAAKKYIDKNIEKYSGLSEITIQELIDNEYLSGDEVNIVTNDLYDVNTRVFFKVANKELVDVYMKSELFKKLFKCNGVCYFDEDKYIYYNNEAYKLLKVDSSGNTYIISDSSDSIYIDNVKTNITNKYNNSNKHLVDSISLLNNSDLINSKLIKINDNTFIETSSGIKMYDITKDDIVDVSGNVNANIIYVIKLANTINYELGDGSRFNPYIISE